MTAPLTLSCAQTARLLDVPERFIPLLQAHGMLPSGRDGVVSERLLRARLARVPWLRLLGVPMSESEMRRLVDPRIRFGNRCQGLGVEPSRGHRLIRLWEVLERAWSNGDACASA